MPAKPVKRTKKNVIKNLKKKKKKIHDYKSPYGVKFWNKILKDSKFYAKNHKVFDKNIPLVIERDWEYYHRCLETETDPEKIADLNRKIYQLSVFRTNEWKTFFDEAARLYPDKRNILYLESEEGRKSKWFDQYDSRYANADLKG